MRSHMNNLNDDLVAVIGHPLYPLGDAVQRLQEEHSLLVEELYELAAIARSVSRNRNTRFGEDKLRWLIDKAAAYREDLRRHADWKLQVLSPMLEQLLTDAPSLLDELHMEYLRAEACLERFFAEAEAAIHSPEHVYGLAEHLLQASRVLGYHFHLEEELLDAVWQQTEMEPGGSD